MPRGCWISTPSGGASRPSLTFPDSAGDRICAYFHTGGTTGMPKVAQHRYSGMIYNGWIGATMLFEPGDVMICPLPLFHVFAAYPVLMSAITAGSHVVFPTPAGYRGEGVFDNFWKLIERWQVSFVITVPTALSALMQRPVDADVSSLRTAISGSAPLPVELYQRFEKATGVQVAEGYGLTEATCLVSCNPVEGVKKVGSVGIPFPYSDVRILDCGARWQHPRRDGGGRDRRDLRGQPRRGGGPDLYRGREERRALCRPATGCGPAIWAGWTPDGYLWITGRAKDLIIRGGHNIDPAVIEEALMAHPAVAFVGAIGQPDAHAGEIPCAYVELVKGQSALPDDLVAFARARVGRTRGAAEICRGAGRTAEDRGGQGAEERIAQACHHPDLRCGTGAGGDYRGRGGGGQEARPGRPAAGCRRRRSRGGGGGCQGGARRLYPTMGLGCRLTSRRWQDRGETSSPATNPPTP